MKCLENAILSKNAFQLTAPIKTLRTVLGMLIERRFLAQFTWSGKSKPGIRKLALKDRDDIVNLLYTIASQIHPKYVKTVFKRDLVDKILKFAYE